MSLFLLTAFVFDVVTNCELLIVAVCVVIVVGIVTDVLDVLVNVTVFVTRYH